MGFFLGNCRVLVHTFYISVPKYMTPSEQDDDDHKVKDQSCSKNLLHGIYRDNCLHRYTFIFLPLAVILETIWCRKQLK